MDTNNTILTHLQAMRAHAWHATFKASAKIDKAVKDESEANAAFDVVMDIQKLMMQMLYNMANIGLDELQKQSILFHRRK